MAWCVCTTWLRFSSDTFFYVLGLTGIGLKSVLQTFCPSFKWSNFKIDFFSTFGCYVQYVAMTVTMGIATCMRRAMPMYTTYNHTGPASHGMLQAHTQSLIVSYFFGWKFLAMSLHAVLLYYHMIAIVKTLSITVRVHACHSFNNTGDGRSIVRLVLV